MKKLDLIQENPFEEISLDYIRYNTIQSHCLVVEVYDHATVELYRVEEDGYKQYTFDDDTHIGLIAPYEFQTEWNDINCWDFISHRMEALRRIGKMEKPRILPEWLSEFPGYEPVSVMWPWECECKPIEDEIGYKPTMRQMRSWMKIRKSDEILWNYYLTGGKGIAPKQWHNHPWVEDDEPWYSDLPGYGTPQGVYLNDGVYGH